MTRPDRGPGHRPPSPVVPLLRAPRRHPSAAGLATVTMEEVTGAQTGLLVLDFLAPDFRRFDFNTSTSPTMAPDASSTTPDGYISTLHYDLTSDAVGYGWVATGTPHDNGALDRTALWISSPSCRGILQGGKSTMISDFEINRHQSAQGRKRA